MEFDGADRQFGGKSVTLHFTVARTSDPHRVQDSSRLMQVHEKGLLVAAEKVEFGYLKSRPLR